MTTPLRLLAFHFWEKLINQNLWVYPIKWDTAKRSFYACITTKIEIAKFLFCEVLLVLIGVGCSGFLLAKQIVLPSPDVSILHIVSNMDNFGLWGLLGRYRVICILLQQRVHCFDFKRNSLLRNLFKK